MEKAIVEIYYTGNNFSAHLPELLGCVSTGKTPEEIRNNINEAVRFHVAESLVDGDFIPDKFKGEYELVYKYDTESLLKYYKGILTNAGLERLTGINQRQLYHYTKGLKKPREAQREKIKTALHRLGRELLSIDF